MKELSIPLLTEQDIDCRVQSVSKAKTGRVVAAQDHNLLGGLGQLVGSCIAEAGIACKLVSRGCPDYFVPIANPEFLYARNGMDADGLYEAMKAMF